MNYPNIDDVESCFKSYFLDALKERERIEKATLSAVDDVFVESTRRVISQLLKEHGIDSIKNTKEVPLKRLSPTLSSFIDEEALQLNKELYYTIQTAIFNAVFNAFSPLARLGIDVLLDQESRVGNANDVPNKNVKGNKLQEAVSAGNLHGQKEKSKGKKVDWTKKVVDYEAGYMYLPGLGYCNIYCGSDESRWGSHAFESLKRKAEAKNPAYYMPKMKSVQKDLIAQSEAIAKSTMQKRQVFNDKEFKVSDRIWGIAQKNKDLLKDIIASNFNKDVTKTAKAIDVLVTKGKETACRDYPDMMKRLNGRIPGYVSFEAYRLARNEMAETTFRATLQDYVDSPYVEGVKWLLANNRLKKYEDACCCNDLAYTDVYGLGRGVFPLDKVPDRPHVMCLCCLAPVSSREMKKLLKKGLEIGNVPTKEWLESAKDEINAQIIKDKENQYGVRLFHNEKQEALRSACIHAIKSHEWFKNGVKDVDKEAFVEDLNKATGMGLFALARYSGEMKVDLYCQDWKERGSRYSLVENKVYCNLYVDGAKLDSKALGFKLGMRTFLHEAGHWVDSNITGRQMGLTLKMQKLYNAIYGDVLNAINKTGRELYKAKFVPLSKLDANSLGKLDARIKQAVTQKIRENIHINSSVSDMYGALTQNTIAGRGANNMYGHGMKYWRYEDERLHKIMVKMEFIAEAFESLGNLKRMEAMQKHLPTAWAHFHSVLNNFLF